MQQQFSRLVFEYFLEIELYSTAHSYDFDLNQLRVFDVVWVKLGPINLKGRDFVDGRLL